MSVWCIRTFLEKASERDRGRLKSEIDENRKIRMQVHPFEFATISAEFFLQGLSGMAEP